MRFLYFPNVPYLHGYLWRIPKYYSQKYGDFWTNVRQNYGRQIDYVDLNFTGELNDSLVVGVAKDYYEIKFNDPAQQNKATFQEKLQAWKRTYSKGKRGRDYTSEINNTKPMPIFEFSKKEYADLSKGIDESSNEKADKIINKYA